MPLIWILEDHLTPDSPALAQAPDAPVVMVESRRAFRMWPFHRRRIAYLVSAMRHFRDELVASGRSVHYHPLEAPRYLDSLSALREAARKTKQREIWMIEPSDRHTLEWVRGLPALLDIELRFFRNPLFLADLDDFARWAGSVRSPLMETFYRRMRREHGVLMDGREPVGGAWNLDKQNRKRLPKGLVPPPVPRFKPDAVTAQAVAAVDRLFADHPGRAEGLDLPVTRADARSALRRFVRDRLPAFGDYEDAMAVGQPTLFHSLLSPALNVGLLAPMECIRAAEAAYRGGAVPLNSAEGFIRQILGWREYVRGIYRTFMPAYRDRNALAAAHPLPDFYWDGRTDMNCLRQVVSQVVDMGWSHHIQRLMVLCNFATLAGLSPQAVNDWFLSMYVDAHDWVVTPNVIGMGLWADGGTMATKPYISSAAYLHRMGDYCEGCRFRHDQRVGDDACPFNHLFWTFLDAHRDRLSANPRMSMMLRNLERIPAAELAEMRNASRKFLKDLPRGSYPAWAGGLKATRPS